MPTSWTKRTRIDETVWYDSAFSFDSNTFYDVSYDGSNWNLRTPINVPLRQENNDYILDDYEYPLMVSMTEWENRTRIDVTVWYDSAFAYDMGTPYDSSYYGSDWTTRPLI